MKNNKLKRKEDYRRFKVWVDKETKTVDIEFCGSFGEIIDTYANVYDKAIRSLNCPLDEITINIECIQKCTSNRDYTEKVMITCLKLCNVANLKFGRIICYKIQKAYIENIKYVLKKIKIKKQY